MPFCSKMGRCAKCTVLASTDMDDKSEMVKASLIRPINPVIIKRISPKRITHQLARARLSAYR